MCGREDPTLGEKVTTAEWRAESRTAAARAMSWSRGVSSIQPYCSITAVREGMTVPYGSCQAPSWAVSDGIEWGWEGVDGDGVGAMCGVGLGSGAWGLAARVRVRKRGWWADGQGDVEMHLAWEEEE